MNSDYLLEKRKKKVPKRNKCDFGSMKYKEIDLFKYLIGVTFRYKLNGFGPEVYFAITNGIIIFTAYIAVLITIIASLDIPASITIIVVISINRIPQICKQDGKYSTKHHTYYLTRCIAALLTPNHQQLYPEWQIRTSLKNTEIRIKMGVKTSDLIRISIRNVLEKLTKLELYSNQDNDLKIGIITRKQEKEELPILLTRKNTKLNITIKKPEA
ncbi:hypothetical protein AGLY_017915 [Aphis glycines]|uniref:Uncharacterized protein n=1 Tax=Aphis glycines TaxID=307491 RepID=A0A6G0SUB9_APHGL|nr:hypothetical protein AGLY_017915 [Aphis glycines]